MSSGHSWADVKKYTLSEIGVFMRSIYIKRDSERIEKFSLDWMSSNVSHEGMEKVLDSMKKESSSQADKPKTKEEIGNEWKRLASFNQR